MIILNDLFNYKPLKIYKTYTEYLENTDTENILDTDDEDYYIRNIKNSSDKNLNHFAMFFVIKYYFNKSGTINKKVECINALIKRFLKEPNGHTYDILKYLILDMDIENIVGMFTTEKILLLFIGEYCIRNEISVDIFLENVSDIFYVFIPYYFYKKPVSLTNLIDEETRLLFLFPNYLNTDYRVQYYMENVLSKHQLEIDGFILKISTDFKILSRKYNPYTCYLLIKNNINIDYEFSTELMILNYNNKSFIIEDTDLCTVEDILYNKVIKWYHKLINKYHLLFEESSINDQDINFLLENNKIYTQITDKYRLVDKSEINDQFSNIIKEFVLNQLIQMNKKYDIETLMNLKEEYFNTIINKKNVISNIYTWKGDIINNDIVCLIKEYHTSKLQTKRYLDNLYDKIMKNKYKNIFIIYLLNRYVKDYSIFTDCLCNGNKDRRINLVDKYLNKYFCNESIPEVQIFINRLRIEGCTCGINYYLSYVYRNQEEIYIQEIAKEFIDYLHSQRNKEIYEKEVSKDYLHNQRNKEIYEKEVSKDYLHNQINKEIYEKEVSKDYLHNQRNKEMSTDITLGLSYKENICNNIPKRYKINISRKRIINDRIVEVKKVDVPSVFYLKRYKKTKSYKNCVKKFVVDYEYITTKYKSTNHNFIKYVTDDHAKNIISDLILYDIGRLNKFINKGYVLKENYIIEVLNRLKKEGDLSVIKIMRNILQKNDKLHLYSMIIYEDLDFYGKNVVLEYLKVSDPHEMMRMLVILNNEDNLNLVIKILNIITKSIKYLDILDKYKNNHKFTKLMVRAYPLLNKYSTDMYNEICSKYKYKEEIDLMKKYHKIN